jgi:hypothetical protein
MQEEKTYRDYAAYCRQLARTMNPKDSQVLLKMAEAWDGRAQEAERLNKKKRDGHGEGLNQE